MKTVIKMQAQKAQLHKSPGEEEEKHKESKGAPEQDTEEENEETPQHRFPLVARAVVALAFAALQVYMIYSTVVKIAKEDSNFLPRTLLLSSSLVFMQMVNTPRRGFSLYRHFAYLCLYFSVVLMFITDEPMLAILAVFATVHSMGEAFNEDGLQHGLPLAVFWSLYVLGILLLFFSPDPAIDTNLDKLTHDDAPPSALPAGYLHMGLFSQPITVAILTALVTLVYLHTAASVHLEIPAPTVPRRFPLNDDNGESEALLSKQEKRQRRQREKKQQEIEQERLLATQQHQNQDQPQHQHQKNAATKPKWLASSSKELASLFQKKR